MLVFLALSALYMSGATLSYAWIMAHWGVEFFPFPFVDLHALFASRECFRLGFDVLAQNPCDVLGRNFDYSPLLLTGAAFDSGVGANNAVAWCLDLAFLLSFALLPPVRRPWELAVMILASLSSMVAFAAERANLDIGVFLLSLAVARLMAGSTPRRWLAYPVTLAAAIGIKYYPIAILILALRERISVFLMVGVSAMGLVAVFTIAYLGDLQKEWALLSPTFYDRDLFGARNLPVGLTLGLSRFAAHRSSFFAQTELISGGILVLLLLLSGVVSWRMLACADWRQAFAKLTIGERLFLVTGAALIVACFFAVRSTDYRGIFLLFCLPGLMSIGRNAGGRMVRGASALAAISIIFAMWGDCIRWNLVTVDREASAWIDGTISRASVFWLLRECSWWWAITILATSLLEFVRRSRTGLALLSALGPKTAPHHQMSNDGPG